MNTTDLVQFPSAEIPERQAARCPPLAPSRYELAAPVRGSIFSGRQFLIDEQRLDGSWARRTTLDVASRAQLVLLDTFLGRARSACDESLAHAIVGDQLPAGGWSLEPGGAVDIDVSVLAYFALKLLGENASQPEMARARQSIRQRGGADTCGASTRLWLALLGQIDYEHCPPIAPEWLLMPACTSWFSADDELRLAARAVAWTLRPLRHVELARGARELFIEQPQHWPKSSRYFAAVSSTPASGLWSRCERFSFLPLRKRALARANFLLTEAAAESNCGAASVDELAWQRIALLTLSHAETSRVIAHCDRRLQQFDCAEADDARSRSETSLTADTARVLEALVASGVGADEPPVSAAIGWLVTHRQAADYKSRPASEIAAILQVGNCLCDTAPIADGILPPRILLAVEDSANPDCCDGPRSAVELENYRNATARVPPAPAGRWRMEPRSRSELESTLARHASRPFPLDESGERFRSYRPNARISVASKPRCECLGDRPRGCAPHSGQGGDGSWTSAGGRLIESTSWAVRGLVAAGAPKSQAAIDAGVNWLLIQEREAGDWREPDDCGTVGGKSTTSVSDVPQTAAVVLALVTAGLADHEATRRGIDFLTSLQLCGDLDRAAWSLLALTRWAVAIEGQAHHVNQPTELRLVCSDAL